MAATTSWLICRPFRVPKRDRNLDECEDAAAIDIPRARFAIADGATESAHSGLWANLLVDAFAHGEQQPPWPNWITPLQDQWSDAVKRPADEVLPWFLEGRERDGAYSTFLGVCLDANRWQALAVGDSCLFHVRGGQLLASFPLSHSAQFDSTPWLIGSRDSADEIPLRQARHYSGEWLPGDRLYLMTDALARWFLLAHEAGGKPWLVVDPLLKQDDEAFADWVERLRDQRTLKNDDTTLVAVCL